MISSIDAGELGAGHSVTALYELIPADSDESVRSTGDLTYQQTGIKPEALQRILGRIYSIS
jgi:Ca-activated chloride channel family protein